jgi:CheY-like chemotaxis protein
VLIVDDNVAFLRVVRALLEEGDPPFRVHTVETAEAALAFVAGQGERSADSKPAFVVLDFHLPDMDAPEVLACMRQRAGARDIPVLVLSQAEWAEDEAAAVAAGGRRFSAKPSELEELHALIVGFWRDITDALPPRAVETPAAAAARGQR